MNLRRYCGTAGLIPFALCLAFVATAQDTAEPTLGSETATQAPAETAPEAQIEAATAPPAAEAIAAPDPAPAPATELSDPNAPTVPGDIAAGKAKAAVCTACHGEGGNSVIAMYPKLAGQHEAYIARQLALFKDGSRDNPIMLGFAASLSPQDMRDLGAYYASQSGTPGTADDTVIAEGPNAGRKFYEVGQSLYRGGDAARGIPACMACHGATGRGDPGSAYPSLAGQHSDYTRLSLETFRSGTAWGRDQKANTIMIDVARPLTDEEILALSSYIEGLHTAPQEVAAQ